MKHFAAIGLGLSMMLAALFIASGKTSKDTAPQPQVAQIFATALHLTPSTTPTPLPTATATLTPVPTVTPIAGLQEFDYSGIQVWLPSNFHLLEIPKGVTFKRIFTPGGLEGILRFYASDSRLSMSLPIPDVSILRVQTDLPPDQVPFGPEQGSAGFQAPQPVSIGRYEAYRAVTDVPSPSGVRVRELIYWIKQGQVYWLIIYSAPAMEFVQDLPVFEQSIRSLTVLRDQ